MISLNIPNVDFTNEDERLRWAHIVSNLIQEFPQVLDLPTPVEGTDTRIWQLDKNQDWTLCFLLPNINLIEIGYRYNTEKYDKEKLLKVLIKALIS